MAGEHTAHALKFYVAAGTAAVLATGSQLLATSDGDGGITIGDENIFYAGQDMIDTDTELIKRTITANLSGLTFLPATLDLILGISSTAGSLLTDGAETATLRTIKDDTYSSYFRLLMHYQASDDDKINQWYAPRCKVVDGFTVPISRRVWGQQDLTIRCMYDATADIALQHLEED